MSKLLWSLVADARSRGAGRVGMVEGRPTTYWVHGVPSRGLAQATGTFDALEAELRLERPPEMSEADRVGWNSMAFSDDHGWILVTWARDWAGKRVVLSIGGDAVESLGELSLGHVEGLGRLPGGLVFVSGPGRCGRRRVSHALLRSALGGARSEAVTIERGLGIIHGDPAIWQIDVGELGRIRHVASYGDGIRLARQVQSDVILVADIPDRDAAEQAVDAAEHGALMIVRAFGRTTADAVVGFGRLLGDLPRVSQVFAGGTCLRAFLDRESQRRIVAEVIYPNEFIRREIEHGRTDIRSSFAQRSVTLDDELRRAIAAEDISAEDAALLSPYPESL